MANRPKVGTYNLNHIPPIPIGNLGPLQFSFAPTSLQVLSNGNLRFPSWGLTITWGEVAANPCSNRNLQTRQ